MKENKCNVNNIQEPGLQISATHTHTHTHYLPFFLSLDTPPLCEPNEGRVCRRAFKSCLAEHSNSTFQTYKHKHTQGATTAQTQYKNTTSRTHTHTHTWSTSPVAPDLCHISLKNHGHRSVSDCSLIKWMITDSPSFDVVQKCDFNVHQERQ